MILFFILTFFRFHFFFFKFWNNYFSKLLKFLISYFFIIFNLFFSGKLKKKYLSIHHIWLSSFEISFILYYIIFTNFLTFWIFVDNHDRSYSWFWFSLKIWYLYQFFSWILILIMIFDSVSWSMTFYYLSILLQYFQWFSFTIFIVLIILISFWNFYLLLSFWI